VRWGTDFEMVAAYPGSAEIGLHQGLIANDKAQMYFAGFTYAGTESFPSNTTMFNQPAPRLSRA
jgi:hypothetical protein